MNTLILMIGAPGSGKTTYCEEKLQGYYRISEDDQGLNGHFEEFNNAIYRKEPLIVIDRINSQRGQRGRYLYSAKKAGYKTKIILLNAEKTECISRCKNKKKYKNLKLEDAIKSVNTYFSGLQFPSKKEADEIEIIGPSPYFVEISDITKEIGERNYIVVGDIHGCLDELIEMLETTGFNRDEDVLISVGDLIDRGPKIRETIEFVTSLPRFYMVRGNHEDKHVRLHKNNNVKISNGMRETINSFGGKIPENVIQLFKDAPLILKIPSGYVVHAGFDPTMLPEEQHKSDCIFMRYFGGENYFDNAGGINWYKLWPNDGPRVYFGHDPDKSGRCCGSIFHLDGGCVFGDYLKSYDSKTDMVYYVNAKRKYSMRENEISVSNNFEQISKREELVSLGMLRTNRTDDGNFAIYTYTDKCVFEKHWDSITLNSRGHIFDVNTGERIACTFSKFFNLGEREEVSFNKLPWDKPYEVYEKLDGWLGTLYRYGQKFYVASRGSFYSAGAKWASSFIQQKDLGCINDEVTLVFEIITPEQKIILDYGGERNLYILAAFNRYTGEEYERKTVEEWSKKIGVPIVKKYDSLKIEDCLDIARNVQEKEGFVIRFSNGIRVKVKTDWYCKIAKIMANLTPISMWECMKEGKVSKEYLIDIPEELENLANEYKNKLEKQYEFVLEKILTTSSLLLNKYKNSRKELAIALKKEGPIIRRSCFVILDKKDKCINDIVMEVIYPKSNIFIDESDFLCEQFN